MVVLDRIELSFIVYQTTVLNRYTIGRYFGSQPTYGRSGRISFIDSTKPGNP